MASKIRYVFKMNPFNSHITSIQIKETVEIMREKYWKNWKKKTPSDEQIVCSEEQKTME